MADEKNKSEFADDKKLGELVEKINKELGAGLKGRPYLLAVTTGYELEQVAGKSKLAAQWSWRSNVFVGSEDSPKMMEFLSQQLRDVVEHPEAGTKAKYKAKK